MSDGLEKLGSGQARPVSPPSPLERGREAADRGRELPARVSVSVVARRNDVNANLVFTWRRRFREQGGFVPVVVEPDRMLPPPPDADIGAVRAVGRMEIALADGSQVIVDREVDGAVLGRVLSVLARR